jgi:hypothetical protein
MVSGESPGFRLGASDMRQKRRSVFASRPAGRDLHLEGFLEEKVGAVGEREMGKRSETTTTARDSDH